MNAAELQTPPAIKTGVCEPCAWRYGKGPEMNEPPLELGRCSLCRGQVLIMPPSMAELDAAARAWLGEG